MNDNKNFSGQNLQGKSFKNADLQHADFSHSDLRGADFSGANLAGADFSDAVTGMRPSSKILVFFLSLVISLISGYMAMLVTSTAWSMLRSPDRAEHVSAYITVGFLVFFIAMASWKGLFKTIKKVLPFMIAIPVIIGLFMVITRITSGRGSFFGLIALLLLVLMFVIGTISRATAGTLASGVLFIIVAVGGGVFGRTVGGGIGTVVMALSCAYISKHALKTDNPDSVLRRIALSTGTFFGTSFKNANLTGAKFHRAVVCNTDFTGAEINSVDWEEAKKQYTLGEKLT